MIGKMLILIGLGILTVWFFETTFVSCGECGNPRCVTGFVNTWSPYICGLGIMCIGIGTYLEVVA